MVKKCVGCGKELPPNEIIVVGEHGLYCSKECLYFMEPDINMHGEK
jgi:hypothetical protein